MNEPDALPDGGLIRKMWAVEAGRYRDHLLRLDEVSRRNRFGGAVSDEFLKNYFDTKGKYYSKDNFLCKK